MADANDPAPSEITTPDEYATRRDFLKKAGLFTVTAGGWGAGLVALSSRGSADPPPEPPSIEGRGDAWTAIAKGSKWNATDPPTDFAAVTTYNNFYELGLSKAAPSKLAGKMKLDPWTVKVEGEVEKPRTLDLAKVIERMGLEERIYRMRCVEAWSMVIPWVGFPLAKLIKELNPTSRAKWVAMETLVDPIQLPGQSENTLDWPYIEGLRMDEAMHPLTLLAVGLYGSPLLGQNGAPLRLVVPWKYGFKGIKSIVKIRFTEKQPVNTWQAAAASEYGFYANVNPNVPHPRWSQATERRIGKSGRIATAMYNGYGADVAHLYANMDLKKYF